MQNSKRDMDKDGLEDPEVYFMFKCSCNIDPDDLIERTVLVEETGRGRLELLELKCSETKTVIVVYNIMNGGNI